MDIDEESLRYEVFVAAPVLLQAPALPDGEPRRWSPVSCTLVRARGAAALVDTPIVLDQADEIADWIRARCGDTLRAILVTHAHLDHWMSAATLADRFGVPVHATPTVVAAMHRRAPERESVYEPMLPGRVGPAPVIATPLDGNVFDLAGHAVHLVDVGHSDTDDTSVVHVPDLGLVAAGDVVYNGVHQSLRETGNGGNAAWHRAIDTVAALDPRWIVSGHKNAALTDDAARQLADTRQYLDDAAELLRDGPDAATFFGRMTSRWPDWLNRGALWRSAESLCEPR